MDIEDKVKKKRNIDFFFAKVQSKTINTTVCIEKDEVESVSLFTTIWSGPQRKTKAGVWLIMIDQGIAKTSLVLAAFF